MSRLVLSANVIWLRDEGGRTSCCLGPTPWIQHEMPSDARHWLSTRDEPIDPESLDAGAQAFCCELQRVGILVRQGGPNVRSPRTIAMTELGGAWAPPTRPVASSEAIRAAGIDLDSCGIAGSVVRTADELGVQATCLAARAAERQWNPYSGHWLCDVGGEYTPEHNPQRWIGASRRRAVELLFAAVHEAVHAQVSYLGMQGLLASGDLDETSELHLASEGIAYLVSDLELPASLERGGYLRDFWEPSARTTHAHAVSPLRALEAAGIRGAEARSDYAYRLYFGDESRVTLPCTGAARTEFLDAYTTERRYVDRVVQVVNPSWNAHYWRRPDIRNFRTRFVRRVVRRPQGTFNLWAMLRARVLEPHVPLDPACSATFAIQRLALKLSELLSTTRSRRLICRNEARRQAYRILRARLSELERALEPTAEQKRGAMSTGDAEEVRLRAFEQLRDIDGPVWRLVHPSATGELMHDNGLDLSKAGSLPVARLRAALEFICFETEDYLAVDPHDPTYLDVNAEAHHWRLRLMRLHGVRPEGDSREPDVAGARLWLADCVHMRRIRMSYPLDWMCGRAYVDPSIGFRHA